MRDHRLWTTNGRSCNVRPIQPGRNAPPLYRYVAERASAGRSIGGDLESKRDESVPVRKRNPDRSSPRPATTRFAGSVTRRETRFFFSSFCNCRAQPAWRHVLQRRDVTYVFAVGRIRGFKDNRFFFESSGTGSQEEP